MFWAGPEHWKFNTRSKAKTTDPAVTAAGVSQATTKRKKKVPFFIDFSAPRVAVKDLERAARPSTINLPASSSDKDTASALLLPEDVRYPATSLFTFFLRPDLKASHTTHSHECSRNCV